MTADFAALRDQMIRMIDIAATFSVTEREMSAGEAAALALEPPEAKFSNPHYSLRHAAFEAGQSIASSLGFGALGQIFDDVENHVGEDAALWLARSWTGVRAPNGAVWSD